MGKNGKELDKDVVRAIRESSKRFGQLYPILIDANGEIIDGEHRRRAIENPKFFKIDSVKTKKDRLTLRLIANHARKGQNRKFWIPTLTELATILEKDGIEKIGFKIAEETGIPYRTIMRYLPDRFKDTAQSQRAKKPRCQYGNQASKVLNSKTQSRATPVIPIPKTSNSSKETVFPVSKKLPTKEILEEFKTLKEEEKPDIKIQRFSNQSWRAIIVPKTFLEKLEKECNRLKIDLEETVTLALMKLLEDLRSKKCQTQEIKQ